MLLSLGTVVTVGRPCVSPWDFWCGTSYGIVDEKFYYVNKTNHTDSILGANLSPVRFSDDGTKAFVASNSRAVAYIYDMSSLKIIDSFPGGGSGHFLWDEELQNIDVAATQSSTSRIVITDVKTNEIIKSFKTETYLFNNSFFLSEDGEMIAYTGPCIGADDYTYAIWILDLINNEQKKIVYTTSTSFLTSPFEEISISPDHKKIVFRFINDLYLKEF